MLNRPVRIVTLATVALAALIWIALPGRDLGAPAITSAEVVILTCSISTNTSIPNETLVLGASSSSNGAPTFLEELPCAETVAGLLRSGYHIQSALVGYASYDIHYTLVK